MSEEQRYLTQTTTGYVVAHSEAFASRNDFRESTEAEVDAHFDRIGKPRGEERRKRGRPRKETFETGQHELTEMQPTGQKPPEIEKESIRQPADLLEDTGQYG